MDNTSETSEVSSVAPKIDTPSQYNRETGEIVVNNENPSEVLNYSLRVIAGDQVSLFKSDLQRLKDLHGSDVVGVDTSSLNLDIVTAYVKPNLVPVLTQEADWDNLDSHIPVTYSGLGSKYEWVGFSGDGDITPQDVENLSTKLIGKLEERSKEKEDVRTYVHEKTHKTQGSERYAGAEDALVLLAVNALDKRWQDVMAQAPSEANAYFYAAHNLVALEEAEAILNEQFAGGQRRVEDFAVSNFCKRLLNIVADAKSANGHEPPLLKTVKKLLTKQQPEQPGSPDPDLSPHSLAMITILFDGQILSNDPSEAFDFSQIVPDDKKGLPIEDQAEYISGRILEKIQQFDNNPQEFAQSVVGSDLSGRVIEKTRTLRINQINQIQDLSVKIPDLLTDSQKGELVNLRQNFESTSLAK